MDFLNTIVKGDNMDILVQMQDESVDCICTDVLYGSGGDFKDYKDLSYNKKDVDAFYYPRIQEMHRILRHTGSIFIQTDWHSDHWLRCILDSVFGISSFRNVITWYYPDTLKSGKNATRFPNNNDVILFYAKSKESKYFPVRIPRAEAIKRGKKFHDPESKRCLYAKDENGKIIYSEYTDVLLDTVWIIGKTKVCSPTSGEYIDYATQKPEEIPRRCILATTEKGDLVADFFMGSGTTCAVAKKLNRDYFGCDMQEKAYNKTLQRLKEIDEIQKNTTVDMWA